MSRLNNRVAFLGLVAVSTYFIGFFIAPISAIGMLVKMLFFSASVTCYACCMFSQTDVSIKSQLIIINTITLLFHAFLMLATGASVIYSKYYSAIFHVVIWTVVPLIILMYGLIREYDSYMYLKDAIRTNKTLFVGTSIVAIAVIACSYDVNGPQFVWDSNLAYNFVLRNTDVFSLYRPWELIFCNHVSFSYFYPVVLFSNMTGSIEYGFFVCNAIYIAAAAFGFSFLFWHMLNKNSQILCLAATVMCMLSPYIFGLSTLYIYDYAAICITPLMIYCALDRKWPLFFICGLTACFIKEPVAVFYSLICISILLYDLIHDKKTIKSLFVDAKYWLMTFVGFVFCIMYFIYGNYIESSPDEKYSLSITHAVAVIKCYCILNYTWLLTIITMVLIVVILLRKTESYETMRAMLFILLPSVAFLCFNIIVESHNNPRYIDCFYPCLLIMTVLFFVTVVRKRVVTYSLITLLTALFIISDFFSVDPMSNLIFDRVDIGSRELYSASGSDKICDNIVYNRQYYGYDLVMGKVLGKALENKNDLIAISTGGKNRLWEVSGKWDVDYIGNDYEYRYLEYYNIKEHRRAPFYSIPENEDNDKITQMSVKYIFPEQSIKNELKDSGSFVYIYFPTLNGGREKTVRDSFEIIEEGEYMERGWKVAYIRGCPL